MMLSTLHARYHRLGCIRDRRGQHQCYGRTSLSLVLHRGEYPLDSECSTFRRGKNVSEDDSFLPMLTVCSRSAKRWNAVNRYSTFASCHHITFEILFTYYEYPQSKVFTKDILPGLFLELHLLMSWMNAYELNAVIRDRILFMRGQAAEEIPLQFGALDSSLQREFTTARWSRAGRDAKISTGFMQNILIMSYKMYHKQDVATTQ